MKTQVTKSFVVLKDFECAADQIVAHGKSTIPQTLQSPEYPTISIWFSSLKDPITLVYEKEEEREQDLIKLRAAIDDARTYFEYNDVN